MKKIKNDYVLHPAPDIGNFKPAVVWLAAITSLVIATVAFATYQGSSPPTHAQSGNDADTLTVDVQAAAIPFVRAPEQNLPALHTNAAASPPQNGSASSGSQNTATSNADKHWINITIQPGDTLSLAFQRNGLSYHDSLLLAHLPDHGHRFTVGLRAGDDIQVLADSAGQVQSLNISLNNTRILHVERKADSFTTKVEEKKGIHHRSAYAAVTIRGNYYLAARQSGLSDNLTMNLAQIFKWDIDFTRDIRPGDRFVVIYNELYRHGKKLRDGAILAAEFINKGHKHKAFRFTNADGDSAYYGPNGKALAKGFHREPVSHYWISSPFSRSRMNPVLHVVRPHWGTDYAVPTGTPIHATSDGKIIYRGRDGGYGNLIEIRFNKHITTRYAHMSRFRKGLHVGSRVRIGEVIGYAGQTGVATGPHVHYEFRVDGKPKNPETVSLPSGGTPLKPSQLAKFKKMITPLYAQIQALDSTMLAANNLPTRS